jgi:hypothetical protein
MSDAGCFSVFCGTDAGSEKILKAMHKMPSTKRSYEFFENCMRLGIPFETNTIIGYPNEGPDDLEAALEVVFDAISYGAGGSDASILQPLPGAEVTAEYRKSIEFVGDAGLGTFLPGEAAELARSRLDTFSGFGFLHFQNRTFEYYQTVLRLIRYFGRHYFLTLRYFKVVCGLHYIDVFEPLLGVTEDVLGESIRRLIADLPASQQTFATALYDYESGCEALVDVDIELEIENVYSPSRQRGAGAGYRLLDIAADVVSLFPNGNAREGVSLDCRETTYLVYLSSSGTLVTLQLSPWQRRLWEELELLDTVELDPISEIVASAHGVSASQARAGVENALATFVEIRADLRSIEDRRLPL